MESHAGLNHTAAEMAPGEAASAIAAIGGSRSWLAERIIAPGWYHLAWGCWLAA